MNELFYKNPYLREFDATVVRCEEDPKGYRVVLDDTAFYPEGGGQPADHGTLNGLEVFDTRKKENVIYHYMKESLEVGASVHGVINWERRFDHMQQHSGEHIFSGVVHKNFGYENIGFHMGEDVITLDFSGVLNWEQCIELETQANQAIYDNLPVQVSFPNESELEALDFRSKKELKGEVRIITIEDIDTCACCGTHVAHTGEVGFVKVLSCINKREGSRVTITCGKRALRYVQMLMEQNRNLSRLLSAKPEEVESAVVHLSEDVSEAKRRMVQYIRVYLEQKVEQYPVGGKLILDFEDEIDANELRKFCNELVEQDRAEVCAGFLNNHHGYNYVIVSKKINLREFSKEINACLNGRGGGSPTMLQGSVQASRKEIEEVIHQLFGE